MKEINVIKFVANASEELTKYSTAISEAPTYECARQIGNRMLGYIDCMITLSNGMICKENNGITVMLDEVEQEWIVKTYQAMIDKADELKVDNEIIWKLLEKRDEYRA